MTKTNLFPSRVQSSGGHIAKVKAELKLMYKLNSVCYYLVFV